MVESTQVKYKNQRGWNDVPDLFAGVEKSAPGARVRPRRRPSGTDQNTVSRIATPPPQGAPPLPSSRKSSLASINSRKSSLASLGSQTQLPSPSATPVHHDDVLSLIHARILSSRLSEKEQAVVRSKLDRLVPSLTAEHLRVISEALNTNAEAGKQLLSCHSLSHNGISPWLGPLQRIL